jgi:hypothetical protein
VFADHVFLTVSTTAPLHARDVIGAANLMWSSDYRTT